MRLKSMNEIIRWQYIEKLKDDLRKKYYYSNRVVKIYKIKNNIYFRIKTRAVNINYIYDFISTLDKNYANQIFNQNINFIVQLCKLHCTNI